MSSKGRENSGKKVSTFVEKGGNQGGNYGVQVSTLNKTNNINNMDFSEIWISPREGGNLLGISVQAVRKNCKNGKYVTRKVRANGGLQYRILLSSLPEEAQKKYFELKKKQSVTKKNADRPTEIHSGSETGSPEKVRKSSHLLHKGRNQGGNFSREVPTFDNCNNNNGLNSAEVWITVKEGGNLLGITERAVKKNCKLNKYTTRMVYDNGGWQYRILLSSLPMEAQIRYWQRFLRERGSEGTLPGHSLSGGRAKTPLPAATLYETERRIALARGDLLRLYLATGTGKDKIRKKKEFIARYNAGAFPELHEVLGPVSFQTLERWKKTWLENNRDDMALAPRYNHQARGRKITPQQAEILVEKALSPNRWSYSKIVREARKAFHERGIACDASDMTLIRFLKEWRSKNMDWWRLLREGEKKLNDRELFYIERNYDEIEVGDIVVADGHTLNFNIINPWTGKPKRMTLILFYDMKSNFPLGWEIMPTENIQAIAAALRRAILYLGFVPRVAYLDNGKAFRAKYFQGVRDWRTSGIMGLFERLGMRVSFAWKYHAQSKTVERFFGTFRDFEQMLPTYVGNSVGNKPAHLNRGEFWHRRMYERLTDGTAPTLHETHRMIREWVAEYVQRPQRDGHLKGKRPLDVFGEGVDRARYRADIGERIVSREELDYLMMEATVRTLYRNGIRLFGRYYYNDNFYMLEKGRGKQEFVVRYDIEDPDYILVYDRAGKFICKAYRTDKIHPAARYLGTDEEVLKLQESIRHKRVLQKETRKIAEAFINHIQKGKAEGSGIPNGSREAAATDAIPETPNWIIPSDEAPAPPAPPASDEETINYLAPINREKPKDEFEGINFLAPMKREKEPEIYLFRTDKELAEERKAREKGMGV